jgi:hypothetical protein
LGEVVHQKNAYEALIKGRLWDAYNHPESLQPEDKVSRNKALNTAFGIMNGFVPDPTDGATMFIPDWVYHGPASKQGDFKRMFQQGRLKPSPYNSRPGDPPKNYFFIEKPPTKR